MPLPPSRSPQFERPWPLTNEGATLSRLRSCRHRRRAPMRVRGWLALPAALLFVLSLLVPSAVLGSATRSPRADATQATLTVLEEGATVISGATGEARVAT